MCNGDLKSTSVFTIKELPTGRCWKKGVFTLKGRQPVGSFDVWTDAKFNKYNIFKLK